MKICNITKCTGEIRAPKVPPFTVTPGLRVPLATTATPLQYLELFLTVHLWQYLVDHTNAYATVRLRHHHHIGPCSGAGNQSQLQKWKCLWVWYWTWDWFNYHSWKITGPHMKHSTSSSSDVFSRNRFLQVFWMLSVGDIDGSTKRSNIQPYLDLTIPTFCQYFIPARAMAVDEVISYWGRVSFRQYVRGKPHPWGIKAYVLAESASTPW